MKLFLLTQWLVVTNIEGGKKKKVENRKKQKSKNHLASTRPWVSTESWISKHDVVSSPTPIAGEEEGGPHRVSNKRLLTLWLDSPSKLVVVTWQVPSARLLERKIKSQGKVSSSLTKTMSPTWGQTDRQCHQMNPASVQQDCLFA